MVTLTHTTGRHYAGLCHTFQSGLHLDNWSSVKESAAGYLWALLTSNQKCLMQMHKNIMITWQLPVQQSEIQICRKSLEMTVVSRKRTE